MNQKYYNLYLILLMAFLLIAGSLSAYDSNLSVIKSSADEFHFVYQFDSNPYHLNGKASDSTGDLYFQTIQIAVPSDATPKIIKAEGRNQSVVDNRFISKAILSSNSVVAQLSDVSSIRGRSVVSVRLYPISGSGIFRQIEIRIIFEHSINKKIELEYASDNNFDKIFNSALANFDIASKWPKAKRLSSTKLSAQASGSQNLVAANDWYKFAVRKTGFYELTGADLVSAGISIANLSSDSIRLFSGGGLPNEIDNLKPRPQFDEIDILIIDGNDNIFNSSDKMIFYGEATGRWLYDAPSLPYYNNNRYTDDNIYWLAVSGDFITLSKRMATRDISGLVITDTVVTSFRENLRVEQENLISTEMDGHIWDFYNWFWSDKTSLTAHLVTPGAITGSSSSIYLRGRTRGSFGTNGYIDLLVNGSSGLNKNCSFNGCNFTTMSLLDGVLNEFRLTLQPSANNVAPYFDYIEVDYNRRLETLSSELGFSIGKVDAVAEIRITVNSSTTLPTIIDIDNPRHPVIVSGVSRTASQVVFNDSLSSGSFNRYFVGYLDNALSPISRGLVNFNDLRTNLPQTDLIIVTNRVLEPNLAEYIAYRSSQGYSLQTVTVEDIMDNFSYGLYDPTAIRDYLKFAYENSPSQAPSAVLFVGDATYDFKDHLSTNISNWVPSYILPGDRTYSDDNYVYFGGYGLLDSDTSFWVGGRGFDMMTSRWPVRSSSEINLILSKIKAYESSTTNDSWKSNITYVADDEHGGGRHTETFHVTQTEILEETYTPRLFNRNKIYLWDYPFVNRDKPEVTKAIINAFNDGTLLINYVGHGNPDLWSDEHVFQRSIDIPKLNNIDRLPLVFAASCDIGFFDDPRREGMAEDFLVAPNGGGVSVISATRLVYASDNANFNRAVYTELFSGESLSICEALYAAKLKRQYPTPTSNPRKVDNDRAYILLGEPFLKLAIPEMKIEFDSNNTVDSLVALSVSHVKGRVVNEFGQTLISDGTLSIKVFDSDRDRIFRLVSDSGVILAQIPYNLPGPAIFQGTASISAGEFEFDFIAPLDMSYRGQTARISTYATLGNNNALGLVDSIPVSSSPALVTDSIGPEITYSIVGRENFVSGDQVGLNEELMIEIVDSSGVNLAGGIGHGINIIIDGQTDKAIDLTNQYEYDLNSFRQGSLIFPLSSLSSGEHLLKVKAWDNANNVSTTEFTIDISTTGKLAINNLLPYPNPMGELTTFYFELTEPTDRLAFNIFTLSGKKIWSFVQNNLTADNYPNSEMAIVWDGRDNDGDRVATGVYLFKATATPFNNGKAVEQFGKLIVVN